MSKDNEKVYPYLGRTYVNEKAYVVLFSEEEAGVVVMNETEGTSVKFGMFGTFDESKFEALPPDVCVRLSN